MCKFGGQIELYTRTRIPTHDRARRPVEMRAGVVISAAASDKDPEAVRRPAGRDQSCASAHLQAGITCERLAAARALIHLYLRSHADDNGKMKSRHRRRCHRSARPHHLNQSINQSINQDFNSS